MSTEDKRHAVDQDSGMLLSPVSQEKIAHELLHMFCQLSFGISKYKISSSDEVGTYKKMSFDPQ